MKNLADMLTQALGKQPVVLLLKNAQVINVLAGEIHHAHVAIAQGRIIGFGEHDAKETIDLNGAYLAPSLIDGHIHIESTNLTPQQFARAVVPHGTGAVIADPHEFANVLGLDGIHYVLNNQEQFPLDIFVTLPSCVPATALESSGATLTAEDLNQLINLPKVVGIAEMMNYPGMLNAEPDVLAKLVLGKHKIIDGHAPQLSDKILNAYILAGPNSDHECTTLEEAQEKLRAGMHVHMREGSSEHNLEALLPLVTPHNTENFSFASDDRQAISLLKHGHLNVHVRLALASGLDPISVFKIATINTARFYNLKNLGAIAPRFWADLIVFDDLKNFVPRLVFKKGALVAKNGQALFEVASSTQLKQNTMRVQKFSPDNFKIKALSKKIRVIELVPQQIITTAAIAEAKIENGFAVSDTQRDLLKFAVIERHYATGRIGLGFVRGFNLTSGALASSVMHDSHNLGVLGTNDCDMCLAAARAAELGGGFVIANQGKIIAELPLPIAGLVSADAVEIVAEKIEELHRAAAKINCCLPHPFTTMSFLALTPLPELRLTDRGLVDVKAFQFVPLFL